MPPKRRTPQEYTESRRAPAVTPEDRENELISLATELAERQMKDGTAAAQVITHYLKLGSSRERLEQQKIGYENELLKVKRESIEAASRMEELYAEAISSLGIYQGRKQADEE